MGTFQVELKKVVDDSYEIEVGFALEDKLIQDLQNGLVGKIHKFAVVTDSNVASLYGEPILHKLQNVGYQADLFVFEAGEKQKTRQTKEMVEDAMLAKQYRRDCCVIAVGGGVVTDLAGLHSEEVYHLSIMRLHCLRQPMHPWEERLRWIHRLPLI